MIMLVCLLVLANIDDAVSDIVIVICAAMIQVIFYQRLGKHIRDTTGIETNNGGQNILPQD